MAKSQNNLKASTNTDHHTDHNHEPKETPKKKESQNTNRMRKMLTYLGKGDPEPDRFEPTKNKHQADRFAYTFYENGWISIKERNEPKFLFHQQDVRGLKIEKRKTTIFIKCDFGDFIQEEKKRYLVFQDPNEEQEEFLTLLQEELLGKRKYTNSHKYHDLPEHHSKKH